MRFPRIARWWLATGSGLGAAAIGYLIPRLVGRLPLLPLVPIPNARPDLLASISCTLAGGFFVYVGARLAPIESRTAATILTILTTGVGFGAFLWLALFPSGTASAAIAGWWLLFGGVVGGLLHFEQSGSGKVGLG
jgi:hypothetical protein